MTREKKITSDRTIEMIAAMSSRYIIGDGKRMPWHLPADLKRFRRVTSPHTVIMGRRTYESIGRPLPRRDNIVVTRQKRYRAPGCRVAASLRAAIALAAADKRVFIIGGGEIYREALPLASRLYLTVIEPGRKPFRGKVRFPALDARQWRMAFRGARRKAPLRYRFLVLVRRRRPGPALRGVNARAFAPG